MGWPSSHVRQAARDVVQRRLAACAGCAHLLDFYAGTGAIGIEALSRGAAHVTFVETDARALKLIDENLRQCGVSDRYVIIRTPQSLPAGSFDLAVLDPPYDVPDLTVSIAAAEPLLAPGGLLVTGTRAPASGTRTRWTAAHVARFDVRRQCTGVLFSARRAARGNMKLAVYPARSIR